MNNAANNFVKICQSLSAIYKTNGRGPRKGKITSPPPPLLPRLEIAARIKTWPLSPPPPLSFPSNMIENSGDDVTLVQEAIL